MRRTILLAEAAANHLNISEAIGGEDFGKVRSIAQGSSSNGKALKQIAIMLSKLKVSMGELEDTLLPYIKDSLTGTGAAIDLADVVSAQERSITGGGAPPTSSGDRTLWWMMRLHQGVKSGSGKKQQQLDMMDDVELMRFMLDNCRLDLGGAKMRFSADFPENNLALKKGQLKTFVAALKDCGGILFNVFANGNPDSIHNGALARILQDIASSTAGISCDAKIDLMIDLNGAYNDPDGETVREEVFALAEAMPRAQVTGLRLVLVNLDQDVIRDFKRVTSRSGKVGGALSNYVITTIHGDTAIEFS